MAAKTTREDAGATSKISTDDHRSTLSTKGKQAPGNIKGKGHNSKKGKQGGPEDSDNTNAGSVGKHTG